MHVSHEVVVDQVYDRNVKCAQLQLVTWDSRIELEVWCYKFTYAVEIHALFTEYLLAWQIVNTDYLFSSIKDKQTSL